MLRALPQTTRQVGDPLTWIGDRVRRIGGAIVTKRWLRITLVVILCLSAASGLLTALIVILIQVLPASRVHASVRRRVGLGDHSGRARGGLCGRGDPAASTGSAQRVHRGLSVPYSSTCC